MTGVDPKTQIRKTPTGCRGFLLHKIFYGIFNLNINLNYPRK